MKETNELVLHIYQDAEMASYTLEKLLDYLKDKDNKIKRFVENILMEYKEWQSKTKKYLKNNNSEISEKGTIEKMMANMGIGKEIKSDNSDSAVADLLIKGVSMGSINIEKKIKEYEKEVSDRELHLATDFLKFQEKTIDKLKECL